MRRSVWRDEVDEAVGEHLQHGEGELRLFLQELVEVVSVDAVPADVGLRAHSSRSDRSLVEERKLAEELTGTELEVLVLDGKRDRALLDEEQTGADHAGLDEDLTGRSVEREQDAAHALDVIGLQSSKHRNRGEPFGQRVVVCRHGNSISRPLTCGFIRRSVAGAPEVGYPRTSAADRRESVRR